MEFAREAQTHQTHVEVALFARGAGEIDNVLTRAFEADQIPFHLLREKRRFDPAPISQIRDLAARNHIDVIWTNSVKSHFLVYLAGLRDTKWVAFHHGYTSTDLKMHAYNQLDRLSLPAANRVLTVCVPFADELCRRGIDRRKIVVQHVPIRPFRRQSTNADALRKEFNLRPDDRVILNVARLSREKDHSNLLKAFALIAERTPSNCPFLFVVGDGVEREKLLHQAASLGVANRVVFTGQRDDVLDFYSIANAFVLSSASEGTPNALMEAMVADVPTVCTSVGGVPELVINGRSGLLTPPSNEQALARALESVLTSQTLRSDLVEGAQRVIGTHSPLRFFQNMIRLFADVLADDSKTPAFNGGLHHTPAR